LQPSSDKSSKNKENIEPDHPLKTLDVAVTPPLETDPKPLNLSSDDGKQDAQTIPMCSSPPPVEHYREVHGSYVELKEKYENLQSECDAYRRALDALKRRHKKDKVAWKAWTEQDLARRAKRKGTSDTVRRRPRTLSPITPATSILKSSPPRPPQISPEKKEHDLGFMPEPVRKGGLFSHLQPSRPARFSPDQTNRRESTPVEENLPSSTSSISIVETLEQNQLELPVYNPNPNPSTTPDVPSSDATTDDSGPEDNQITPKAAVARNNPMLPPPSALEKPDLGRAGSTPFKPVIIKSEPVSSQSDPGYFVFDPGSLDLDDVGPEPEETLRKKRKVETVAGVNSTHVGAEPEPEAVPVLLGVQLHPSEIRTASQLVRFKTPEAKATPHHSPPAPPSAVRRPGGFTTSTRTPAKDPLRHSGAIQHILEDGTDGTRVIAKPPSTKRKRLEQLLSTPARPTPSLRPLLRGEVNTRSTPSDGTKRKIHGANLITPTATTAQGKKQLPTPATDPPLPQAVAAAPKLTDFKINPAANGGVDFAYAETVRGREARKCLPGCTRPCCREVGRFVEAAGLPRVERKLRWRSSSPVRPNNNDEEGPVTVEGKDGKKKETGAFVQMYGKHRDAFPRHTTPPGFWNSGFPDSLEMKQYREQADMMEREKVEERKREAEKGKGGRFVKR
jgi:hypothetical protein